VNTKYLDEQCNRILIQSRTRLCYC